MGVGVAVGGSRCRVLSPPALSESVVQGALQSVIVSMCVCMCVRVSVCPCTYRWRHLDSSALNERPDEPESKDDKGFTPQYAVTGQGIHFHGSDAGDDNAVE